MMIYIADRNLNIVGTASTDLPRGLTITNDEKSEDLESGTKVFECELHYEKGDGKSVDDMVCPGFFLLRSYEDENEFYTITEVQKDTFDQSIHIYAEDGGLDLLNTVVPEYAAASAMTLESYAKKFLPTGWEIGINESSGSKKISWDGEATVTERLVSIANNFNMDISYSFEIKRLTITHKYVNFHKHRGEDDAKVHLYLNQDIKKIVTTRSTENLATALSVTGGTLSGKSSPITLKNYTYSYTDSIGDRYEVDKSTGQMRNVTAMRKWAGALDSDGLILKRYSYDTISQAVLAGQARVELQKCSDEEINYEVEFTKLNASIGDRVYIIDDESELYLDARILTLKRSVTNKTVSATLGEYLIKDSGISDRLTQLAKELKKKTLATAVLTISSSTGTVFQGGRVSTVLSISVKYSADTIRDMDTLMEIFGEDVSLIWYENGTKILSTDSRISDSGFTLTLDHAVLSENTKYECRLEG